MPRFLTVVLLFLITVMLALPATIGSMGRKPTAALPNLPPVSDGADTVQVKVYFPTTKQVETMTLGEYLKGVVAAEMPPEFAAEALKAQFVVARTYTVRRMQQFGGKGGCPLSPEADVCADFSTSQAYISRADLVKRYGQLAADSYWRRLSAAQAATAGQVLTYRGELIDALYHGVSGRATENAEEYFSTPAPYLVSVDDRAGAEAPRLVVQQRFAADAFAKALAPAGKEAPVLAVTAATRAGRSPVQVTERTSSGRVKQVKVGDLTLSGREFRERLGLRSTDFRVFLEGGEVVVETFGNGHGVGMSQYGADGMAREGSTYQEILLHYYQGVALSRLFEG